VSSTQKGRAEFVMIIGLHWMSVVGYIVWTG
jgi:hypothetical protein